MDRLFLPFEQENAATGKKYGGTGLGMAISKNLVTLMGGTISIQSEPGEGSAFAIELEFDISGKAGKEKLQKAAGAGSTEGAGGG